MKKVLLGMSGGIDSSVAAYLLKQQGYEVEGVTMLIWRPDSPYPDPVSGNSCYCKDKSEDLSRISMICSRLGLRHTVIDCSSVFEEEVLSVFRSEYISGHTPNPCVMCNSRVKFGAMLDRASESLDFDLFATGHYARIFHNEESGRYELWKAVDMRKDQSYFLSRLSQKQLSRTLFPLGEYMKEDVRRIAKEAKLPSALRKDSQGICFLGKINYNDFIRRFLGEQTGKIIEIESGRIIGTHRGFWFHTIGQRKGLGLSGGPWFVIDKDVEQNIVYVSRGYDTEKQYGNTFRLAGFHFITANPWTEGKETEIRFKIRHTDTFGTGYIVKENNHYLVTSNKKIQGIAPGQFGVIYDKDAQLCIGSGEIRR